MKRFLPLLVLLVAQTALGQLAFGQTPLREDTSRLIRICGAVAVADGFTPVTTLTLSGADEAEALREGTATLDISGATFAAITGADGCYSLTLDTTATSTVGELIVVIQDDSLILPIYRTFQVVNAAIFDACCVSASTGQVTVATGGIAAASFALGAIDAAAIATDAIGAAEIATGAIDAAATAADFSTEIQDVDVEQVNGGEIFGAGTSGDKFRGTP
jgi:hypothetical protein